MRRTKIQLGQRFGKLTVIGFEPSDSQGHQQVRVRCGCPDRTEKVIRVSKLTMKPYVDKHGVLRKPAGSCGCESKRAHREHWEGRAKGFPKKTQRAIWQAHQAGEPFATIGARYKLPVGVVSAIVRVYNHKQGLPKSGKSGSSRPKAKARRTAFDEWLDKHPIPF